MAEKTTYGGYRANSGRKALPESEKRKPHSFVATDAEWREIGKHAKDAGLSIGEYIRQKTLT